MPLVTSTDGIPEKKGSLSDSNGACSETGECAGSLACNKGACSETGEEAGFPCDEEYLGKGACSETGEDAECVMSLPCEEWPSKGTCSEIGEEECPGTVSSIKKIHHILPQLKSTTLTIN